MIDYNTYIFHLNGGKFMREITRKGEDGLLFQLDAIAFKG